MPLVKLPFDARYRVEGECWIWIRRTKSTTYGWCGKRTQAHRKSYEAHHGPIPPGMQIAHSCNRKQCVNPAHLVAVTGSVNMLMAVADGIAKGAQITPQMRIEIGDLGRFTEMTQQEIADVYQLGQMTVSRILARQGIKRGRVKNARPRASGQYAPGAKLTDVQREEMWALRDSGRTYQDIGAQFGVTAGAVSHLYKKRGLRKRGMPSD